MGRLADVYAVVPEVDFEDCGGGGNVFDGYFRACGGEGDEEEDCGGGGEGEQLLCEQ